MKTHKDMSVEETLEYLYRDDAKALRQMCDRELKRFSGISQKDFDDFYSRVGCDIAQAITLNKYDPNTGKSFLEYVAGIIRFSVRKEMSYRNRMKRQTTVSSLDDGLWDKQYLHDISLDSPTDGHQGKDWAEKIEGDSDVRSDEMIYDSVLSHFKFRKERKIVTYLIEGYTQDSIAQKMGITPRRVTGIITSIRNDTDLLNAISEELIPK